MENNKGMDAQWTDQRLAALRSDGDWTPDTDRGLSRLRERLDADARGRKYRAWAFGAVGVMCAAMLVFPVTRAFAQRCVDACVDQTSRVSGLLLHGFSSRETPSAGLVSASFKAAGDRKTAPDFMLADSSGKAVRLSDFRGKAVLLNFWATWCAPCKLEIPWFVEFERNYGHRNFAVLGVSMDEDGWKAVNPYMEAVKVNYPVVIGNDEVSKAFGGIESLPVTLLIDKAGRIASVHVGLCGKGDYEAEIKTLLEESL
jgi:cytochrome c biogenesis protein CcmG/thiol:disulfide interchange protein DsbE